jgi:hypothetical protein
MAVCCCKRYTYSRYRFFKIRLHVAEKVYGKLLLHKTLLIAFDKEFITVHLLLLKIRLSAVDMDIFYPAIAKVTAACC